MLAEIYSKMEFTTQDANIANYFWRYLENMDRSFTKPIFQSRVKSSKMHTSKLKPQKPKMYWQQQIRCTASPLRVHTNLHMHTHIQSTNKNCMGQLTVNRPEASENHQLTQAMNAAQATQT